MSTAAIIVVPVFLILLILYFNLILYGQERFAALRELAPRLNYPQRETRQSQVVMLDHIVDGIKPRLEDLDEDATPRNSTAHSPCFASRRGTRPALSLFHFTPRPRRFISSNQRETPSPWLAHTEKVRSDVEVIAHI